MNILCELFGHKPYRSFMILGQDRGYKVPVIRCQRRWCELIEDVDQKEEGGE